MTTCLARLILAAAIYGCGGSPSALTAAAPAEDGGSPDVPSALPADVPGSEAEAPEAQGGDGQTAVTLPPCEAPPPFAEAAAHVIAMKFVAQVEEYACDASGDGVVDATDGTLNETLAKLPLQINTEIKKAIEGGELTYLIELHDYAGGDAQDVTVDFLLGVERASQPDPVCNDLADEGVACDWRVNPASFDSDCAPLTVLPGAAVQGGRLAVGPTDFRFTFDLGAVALPVRVTQGRMSADVSGMAALENARLCGTVMREDLFAAIDVACASDEPPPVCAIKDSLGLFVACNPCRFVFSLEAVPVGSLTLAP